MKHPIAILIVISCTIVAFGQKYSPVLDSDTVQWNYLSDLRCADCLETVIFRSYGDTIYNDISYKKLFISYNQDPEEYFYGFLLEDTLLGQLQLRTYNYKCPEYPCDINIIYDMNLLPGDSIEIKDLYWADYSIVTDVDSSGDRRRILFENDGFELIEGIGTTRELNPKSYTTSGYSELLCKYNDGELIYTRRVLEYDTCNIFRATVIEEIQNEVLKVYPNPASFDTPIQIKMPHFQKCQVEIYDINGVLVYSEEIHYRLVIPPTEFCSSPGAYIVRIWGKSIDKHGIIIIE